MCSLSEFNNGVVSPCRIDEISSTSSNSLGSKSPIAQNGQNLLLSQNPDELPNGYGVQYGIPSGKSIKKVIHSPFDFSDRNSSKPGPSHSPRNGKIAASPSSTKVASPKLTLIDLFTGDSGNDINISQRTNIRPPSNTPTTPSSSSSSSQASTTPIEIIENTLGKQWTQKTTTPSAKKKILPLKKRYLFKRQLAKSATLDETSLMTKTTQNGSEESDRSRTPTVSPNFSPNSSGAEYDGNNISYESETSTIPLVLAPKKLKTATKGEIEEMQVGNEDQTMDQTADQGSIPMYCKSTQARKTEGTAKKIRKKKVVGTHYYRAVARTLRRTKSKAHITLPSLQIMDNFMKDMFDRLSTEAGRLMRISGRKTMTARDIQFATTLVLPEKLAAGATWAGGKALERFAKETTRLQRDIQKPQKEIENQQEKSS